MRNPAPGSSSPGPIVTERVTVPSSQHVAEIVGRQGCKIQALRNRTNTYIKTPSRVEGTLFVISGQRESVALAVQEIHQASAHFTNIRAERIRGLVIDRVQVPYRHVGLVVGPRGQKIKQIQTKTSTLIITPIRESEPIFEISGLPENVAKAREEIVSHITVILSLEERAVRPLTFNDVSNSVSLTGKIPTGIWNSSKQDVDESVSDALTSAMSGLYGDSMIARTTQANVRPFTGRPITTLTNAIVSSSGVRTSAGSRRENRDPLRSTEFRAATESISNLLKSPMQLQDLNINTYKPFNLDSGAWLQQRINRNESPAERGEPLSQNLGADFDLASMPFRLNDDGAKLSPLSNDPSSESSGTSRGFGNGSPSGLHPTVSRIADPVASSFGVSMSFGSEVSSASGLHDAIGANTWVLSPPRLTSQVRKSPHASKCSIGMCNARINSTFIPCGHKTLCYGCAKEYIGLPCPSCYDIV
ncbi:RNA-binding protein MEX3B-like isoform X2 [Symsagittifera roscoffensis]